MMRQLAVGAKGIQAKKESILGHEFLSSQCEGIALGVGNG